MQRNAFNHITYPVLLPPQIPMIRISALKGLYLDLLGLEMIFVDLVDLVKRFPNSSWLRNVASIQPRMSPLKFAEGS